MLDNIINGMERGARAVSELLYGPVHSYCRLETVDGDVLVADDGSLISVLRLEGSLKHVGTEEFTGIVSTLTDRPDLARCENGQLSLGTNAGILLMLERR